MKIGIAYKKEQYYEFKENVPKIPNGFKFIIYNEDEAESGNKKINFNNILGEYNIEPGDFKLFPYIQTFNNFLEEDKKKANLFRNLLVEQNYDYKTAVYLKSIGVNVSLANMVNLDVLENNFFNDSSLLLSNSYFIRKIYKNNKSSEGYKRILKRYLKIENNKTNFSHNATRILNLTVSELVKLYENNDIDIKNLCLCLLEGGFVNDMDKGDNLHDLIFTVLAKEKGSNLTDILYDYIYNIFYKVLNIDNLNVLFNAILKEINIKELTFNEKYIFYTIYNLAIINSKSDDILKDNFDVSYKHDFNALIKNSCVKGNSFRCYGSKIFKNFSSFITNSLLMDIILFNITEIETSPNKIYTYFSLLMTRHICNMSDDEYSKFQVIIRRLLLHLGNSTTKLNGISAHILEEYMSRTDINKDTVMYNLVVKIIYENEISKNKKVTRRGFNSRIAICKLVDVYLKKSNKKDAFKFLLDCNYYRFSTSLKEYIINPIKYLKKAITFNVEHNSFNSITISSLSEIISTFDIDIDRVISLCEIKKVSPVVAESITKYSCNPFLPKLKVQEVF